MRDNKNRGIQRDAKLTYLLKKILGFDSDPEKPLFSLANAKELIGVLVVVFLIRTFIFGLYQVPSGSAEPTLLIGERVFADKLTYLFSDPTYGDLIAANQPNYAYATNPLMLWFQEYVWGPQNWTKRIIGVPGDTIEGRIEDGHPVIYRNGEKLHEPYLNPYPLIAVWKVDPSGLMQHMTGRDMDEIYKEITTYSYDPTKSYQDQPFYNLDRIKIVRDMDGNPLLQWPGTAIYPKSGATYTLQERSWDHSDVFKVTLADDEYWCMGDNRLGSSDSRYFGPFKRRLIHAKIRFCIWSHESDASWAIVELIMHPIRFFKQIRWNRCLKWVQ
jgi:signal peptidase I